VLNSGWLYKDSPQPIMIGSSSGIGSDPPISLHGNDSILTAAPMLTSFWKMLRMKNLIDFVFLTGTIIA